MDEDISRKINEEKEILQQTRQLPEYDAILLSILQRYPGTSQREVLELYKKRRSEVDIVNEMRENIIGKTFIRLGSPGDIVRTFKKREHSGIITPDTSEDKDLLEQLYQEAYFRYNNHFYRGNN